MRNKAFKKLSPAEKELKILGALDKKTAVYHPALSQQY